MTSSYRSRCANGRLRGRRPSATPIAVPIRPITGLWAGILTILLLPAARAAAETTAPADDSVEAQQEALAALPLDQLNHQAQARLWDVVSRPTIYRRLPTETVACDPELYLTLVRHPDIIVGIWRMMRVTDVTMQCTAPFHFQCDDKAGTTSQVELVYGAPNLHVYYADTLYEGPLLARPVKARVVLLLRTEYAKDGDGALLATSQMDAFIRIDHVAANLVARTLSPLVGRTADHNFTESFRFLGRVNETAEENGPGMQQFAMRLEDVALPTRQKFAAAAAAVAQRARDRQALADFSDASSFVVETRPVAQHTAGELSPTIETNISGEPAVEAPLRWRAMQLRR